MVVVSKWNRGVFFIVNIFVFVYVGFNIVIKVLI